MMKRIACAGFWLSLTCAACFAQTWFQGLTPGESTARDVKRVLGQQVRVDRNGSQEVKRQPASFQELTPGVSTRNDVERVLGPPARIDPKYPTEAEYKPAAGIKVVVVGYTDTSASAKVDYISVYLLKPVTRAALIQKFNLPQQADAQETDKQGMLREYFGKSLVEFSYISDASSGVKTITYMDEALFAIAVREARKKQ